MNMTGNELKAFIDEFELGDTVITGMVHIGKGGGNPDDTFELPDKFYFQSSEQKEAFYAHKSNDVYYVTINGLNTKWTVEEVEECVNNGSWNIVILF